MNPEDNIKNFFQSRLKENDPQADGWNIPSDDIWNKAKVQFHKEERTRRPYLFLLFGLLGLSVVTVLAYTGLTKNNNEFSKLAKIEQIDIKAESATLSDNDIKSKTSSTQKTRSKEDSAIIKTKTSSIVIDSKNKSRKENNIIEQTTSREAKSTSTRSQTIDKRSGKEILSNRKNDDLNSIEKNDGTSNQLIARVDPDNNNTKNTTLETNERITNQKTPSGEISKSILEDENEKNELVQLKKLSFNLIDQLESTLPNADHLITPLTQDKKWEIGISTSPLLLPIEQLINADTLDNDVTSVDIKYFGLNIPVTRILNNKWSISTGLYYKQGKIRAQFAAVEMLNIGDNISYDDDSSVASISLEDQTEEIGIDLKPDADVRDGDMIRINGYGVVKLNALQIPLFVNYHIRKNRFEYIFSLGASLDLGRIEISEFDITLSNENRVITEPIKYTPLSADIAAYTTYGSIGTKYHFNENTNMSYSLRADLTGIIFSTHEIGLHYRF